MIGVSPLPLFYIFYAGEIHSAKEKFASFYRYILCLINQMIEFTPCPPLVFLLFF